MCLCIYFVQYNTTPLNPTISTVKLLQITEVKPERLVKCLLRQREPVLRRLRVTPLGLSFRVIVNETHINLEKTTSSVLSVILINL